MKHTWYPNSRKCTLCKTPWLTEVECQDCPGCDARPYLLHTTWDQVKLDEHGFPTQAVWTCSQCGAPVLTPIEGSEPS